MSIPTTDPATMTANRIANQVGALTAGTNLFIGPVRGHSETIPLLCVFIQSTGGPYPERMLGSFRTVKNPHVQVRVRGDGEGGYQAGLDLARQCAAAVDGWHPGGGYMVGRLLDSDVSGMGLDSQGNPEFVFNLEFLWSG